MKTIKTVLLSLCALSFSLTVSMPILSSYMQSYYKDLIGTYTKDTQELLEKKHLWVQLGQTKAYFCVFLVFALVLIILTIIVWLKERGGQD